MLLNRPYYKKYLWPDYSKGSLKYDRPKKCPTILYAVNLWLKQVGLRKMLLSGWGRQADDAICRVLVLLTLSFSEADAERDSVIWVSGAAAGGDLTRKHTLIPCVQDKWQPLHSPTCDNNNTNHLTLKALKYLIIEYGDQWVFFNFKPS